MLLEHVQNLPAILGLRHDLEIRLQRQQAAQAVAEYGVVVRHHDANLGCFAGYGWRRHFLGAIVFRHKLGY
jgi:hypothetical protein